MFGFGFWEIIVIVGATIVVVKPEDIPKLLRFLGHLYGRWARWTNSIRASIEDLDITK